MTGARENAAQLDRAIDALLRGPAALRALPEGDLVGTARLLREALPRLHPPFGFEDALAARLAAVGRPADAPADRPTPIHPRLAVADDDAPDAADATDAARAVDAPSERRRRGLLAGGAIASGVSLALPLAGAAVMMWRRSRSSGGIL